MQATRWAKLHVLALLAVLSSAAGVCAAQGLPPTIRVGVSAALTGPGAVTGITAKTMIDMAVKGINAAGGIAGRPVELFYGDDQADATHAVTETKRLISQEKVHFVLGPGAAAPALAGAPDLTRAKL